MRPKQNAMVVVGRADFRCALSSALSCSCATASDICMDGRALRSTMACLRVAAAMFTCKILSQLLMHHYYISTNMCSVGVLQSAYKWPASEVSASPCTSTQEAQVPTHQPMSGPWTDDNARTVQVVCCRAVMNGCFCALGTPEKTSAKCRGVPFA